MKRRNIGFFAIVAAVVCLNACKSRYEILLASNDVDAKYEEAFKLFDKAKYKKAATMFESLSMLTSGMAKDDTVRYYWSLSNYRNQDYPTAQANFSSFIEFYPMSPFTSEARFLRLDCMFRASNRYELDQNSTNLAIIAISEYIMEYPQSERIPVCRKMLDELNGRLDQKSFEAARLYYRMEDYIASKTAFKNILKDDPENIYREEILYYIAKSDYKYAQLSVASKQKERYMVFVDSYLNFVGELPESAFRSELDRLYQKVQIILGSGGVQAADRKTLRDEKKSDKQTDRQISKEEKKK